MGNGVRGFRGGIEGVLGGIWGRWPVFFAVKCVRGLYHSSVNVVGV